MVLVRMQVGDVEQQRQVVAQAVRGAEVAGRRRPLLDRLRDVDGVDADVAVELRVEAALGVVHDDVGALEQLAPLALVVDLAHPLVRVRGHAGDDDDARAGRQAQRGGHGPRVRVGEREHGVEGAALDDLAQLGPRRLVHLVDDHPLAHAAAPLRQVAAGDLDVPAQLLQLRADALGDVLEAADRREEEVDADERARRLGPARRDDARGRRGDRGEGGLQPMRVGERQRRELRGGLERGDRLGEARAEQLDAPQCAPGRGVRRIDLGHAPVPVRGLQRVARLLGAGGEHLERRELRAVVAERGARGRGGVGPALEPDRDHGQVGVRVGEQGGILGLGGDAHERGDRRLDVALRVALLGPGERVLALAGGCDGDGHRRIGVFEARDARVPARARLGVPRVAGAGGEPLAQRAVRVAAGAGGAGARDRGADPQALVRADEDLVAHGRPGALGDEADGALEVLPRGDQVLGGDGVERQPLQHPAPERVVAADVGDPLLALRRDRHVRAVDAVADERHRHAGELGDLGDLDAEPPVLERAPRARRAGRGTRARGGRRSTAPGPCCRAAASRARAGRRPASSRTGRGTTGRRRGPRRPSAPCRRRRARPRAAPRAARPARAASRAARRRRRRAARCTRPWPPRPRARWRR